MQSLLSPLHLSPHPTSLPIWVAVFLVWSPGCLHAADTAPPGKPPQVQRLDSPENRAALTEKINTTIEQTKARSPRKPVTQPKATTIAVQNPSRQARRQPPSAVPDRAAPTPVTALPSGVADASVSRRYITERAAELAANAPPPPLPDPQNIRWSYQGETGPQAWGQLHPAFSACDKGEQQSPIHITAQDTASGPAETLQPGPQTFGGTINHTGDAIELEVEHANTLALRGTSWQLMRVQFHHPAEERIHFQKFPMSTDLVYRGAQGQIAVLSVPMQLGTANNFIHKIWTHMPLGPQDRVRLAEPELRLRDLLPPDLRYYMYLGSLTSPPCTEGVLRLVLQTPATVSRDQWQLLTRMTPPNARPTQPLHGRRVREAR